MRGLIFFTLALLVLEASAARTGFMGGKQDWGHVDVREGAHMFWWLHYTTATDNHIERPLILWLQGGPGSSSTGFGNFEILGPYDLELKERSFSWIHTHNVLFVDNPVGTGFSYVDSYRFLTKDNKQIALDLVELLRGFYEACPEFKTVPLHIFGESYGGKMAVEFAHELNRQISEGLIESNLITVAMGDAWISPIDSTLSWAPYLLQLGFIDEDGYEKINNFALRTKRAFDAGNFFQSTDLWGQTEIVLQRESHGVDFYNVLFDIEYKNSEAEAKQLDVISPRAAAFDVLVNRRRLFADDDNEKKPDPLKLMMLNVTEVLGIENAVWGAQSRATFDTLAGDFMKPVVDIVADLLTNSSVKVVVYSGQLDLICSTPGTVAWVNNMHWYGNNEYKQSPRVPIDVNKLVEGYQRHHDNFSMYWINNAGHMAPFDNPRAMGYVLQKVTNFGQ